MSRHNSSAAVPLTVPPEAIWRHIIEGALREDLGSAGDLTTEATVDPEQHATVAIQSRTDGVLAGLPMALHTFRELDSSVEITVQRNDGESLEPGARIATIHGSASGILIAERTALNLLGRLCGIASATADLTDRVEGTGAQVVCTRKTTPGLRVLEKYAVRCGGGHNHRFALSDAVLIKDNHIAFAGGIDEALRRAFERVGHMVKVEVEVDTLEQLERALLHPVDAVLLDNMSPDQLRAAVAKIEAVRATGRKVVAEASGGIRPETIRSVAESGVDLISVGYLTHSAPALDVGLDWVE